MNHTSVQALPQQRLYKIAFGLAIFTIIYNLAEGMLEQRFQPDTSVYVTVEDELLKLNSQSEYEEANAPVKKSRKKKDEDREPELSGAGASGDNSEK